MATSKARCFFYIYIFFLFLISIDCIYVYYANAFYDSCVKEETHDNFGKVLFISFCFRFSRRIRSGRFLTLIFLYTYVLVIEIDILKPCINIIVLKSIFLRITKFFKIIRNID